MKQKTIGILGGTPRDRAIRVPMLTRTVMDAFEEWWTSDSRFAPGQEHNGVYPCSFEDVVFEHTHVYLSDMWMTETSVDSRGLAWKNNGLDVIIRKYMAENDPDDWHKFRLVHKLTWSKTHLVCLAQALVYAKRIGYYRINASYCKAGNIALRL